MTFATLVHPIICSLIASALFFLTPDQIRDPFLNSTYIGGSGNTFDLSPAFQGRGGICVQSRSDD
jgi:hypothetical protein